MTMKPFDPRTWILLLVAMLCMAAMAFAEPLRIDFNDVKQIVPVYEAAMEDSLTLPGPEDEARCKLLDPSLRALGVSPLHGTACMQKHVDRELAAKVCHSVGMELSEFSEEKQTAVCLAPGEKSL